MDELEISGKRYISTRRAAREHGYHSDYMGQLIRSKKVVGQKVGRAWYIEEDSLNAYLSKEPAPAPIQKEVPAAVAEALPAVAAPVEHLTIEEPAPMVVPAPQPTAEIVMPEPVAIDVVEEIKEEAQPIALHIEKEIAEPMQVPPAVQEIHHVPYIEERETRIPIRTQPQDGQEIGGLRYDAANDFAIPMVTRMPQTHTQGIHAPAKHRAGKFPYVSLSVIAIMAILAATFASNFVSATMVSEPGKAATVQYAIHW